MKKIIFYILLLVMASSIIGCSTKENAENLLNNIVKKSKELKSIDAEIKIDSQTEADFPQQKGVIINLDWQLNYQGLPEKKISSFSGQKNITMKKNFESEQHNSNVQAYISDGEMYRSITINNKNINDKWDHKKVDESQILKFDDMFLLYNDMLTNVKDLNFKDGNENYYIISGKVNTDNISKILLNLGTLIDQNLYSSNKNPFNIELYINKKTKMPVELIVDISNIAEKTFLGDSKNEYTVKSASAKLDIIYKSFDEINDISIPQEAIKKEIGTETNNSKPRTGPITASEFRSFSYKGSNFDGAVQPYIAFQTAALHISIDNKFLIEENNYLRVLTIDKKKQFAVYKNLDKPDRLVIYPISADGTINTNNDLFNFIYNSNYPLTGTECKITLEYENKVINNILNKAYNGKTIEQAIASTGDELYSATTFNMSSNHMDEQLLISTKNNKRYKYYFINDVPYLFECKTKEIAYGTQEEMKSFGNLNLANEFFK